MAFAIFRVIVFQLSKPSRAPPPLPPPLSPAFAVSFGRVHIQVCPCVCVLVVLGRLTTLLEAGIDDATDEVAGAAHGVLKAWDHSHGHQIPDECSCAVFCSVPESFNIQPHSEGCGIKALRLLSPQSQLQSPFTLA